jgi:hypothetical protein
VRTVRKFLIAPCLPRETITICRAIFDAFVSYVRIVGLADEEYPSYA